MYERRSRTRDVAAKLFGGFFFGVQGGVNGRSHPDVASEDGGSDVEHPAGGADDKEDQEGVEDVFHADLVDVNELTIDGEFARGAEAKEGENIGFDVMRGDVLGAALFLFDDGFELGSNAGAAVDIDALLIEPELVMGGEEQVAAAPVARDLEGMSSPLFLHPITSTLGEVSRVVR